MQYIDVQKTLDQAKPNKFHFKILFWCFLIIVIDGYDIAVAGAAIPSIMEQMHVNASTAGFMASSALFGMMFGAIFFGGLSEKIGRRWTISICVFLFSIFTAAAGFCKDPVSFSLLRFIAGLGIGGVMPNIVAHMTEFSPKKMRSFMTTMMFSGYAVGGILAAALGKQFILAYGWQVVFFAAGIPIIIIPFILKYLPESLTYLNKSNQKAQLHSIIQNIEPSLTVNPNTLLQFPMEPKTENVSITQLFNDGRLISSVMFWIAFFTGLFMIYSLSTWLTKLMALSGYSLGSALSFVIALNLGAVVGCAVGGWLADRFHIKWVLVTMYFLGGIFLYMMTFEHSQSTLYFIIAAVGACSTGAQIVAYAYCGQFYPSNIRSTGIGMAGGIGRLGAILAPLIIGYIVTLNLPLEQNFMVIAAAGIVGAIGLAFINHDKAAA
ncbi:MFS transporter [Acinetobacter nematophilus]|uniref:Aromatic acid/H+ symport family MFS transporter n=1 Tax=Acinetobacter nematophilus TaxID=2994642 RepID=A0A9X3IG92_9GAMM|nr:aromatic acid/H+ symport family MFS transporter [Acinetobacter nematophilus]MCX5467452.1 aromatic acid/H+ symport family MFS transporter [Acinetobacter nematophilus]